MSDYSSLKATINANVKTNDNHEITGSIMNSVLNAMVNSLGAGYQFIGVATPTNPGSAQNPDYKCFYLATTPGTYTYLGGLVVSDGEVALLKYDSSWTKEVTGIASADKLNQLGQKTALKSAGFLEKSNVNPQLLYWENKNIVSYVASDSPNRCIALIGASNANHIKVVPNSGWYINLWFFSECVISDNLSADIGLANAGVTNETIEMDIPSGCSMIALWCRNSDNSNFDKSTAYQAYSSIEVVTDRIRLDNAISRIVNLEGVASIALKNYGTIITSGNYTLHLSDANDALDNMRYRLECSGNKPSNLPSDVSEAYLLNFATNYSGNPSVRTKLQQIVTKDNKTLYYRTYTDNVGWSAWVSTTLADTSLHIYPTAIRRQNYQSFLPDANSASINTVYFVYTNQGTKPNNFPSGYSADGNLYMLTTYKSNIEAGVDYIFQTLVRDDGTEHYFRQNTGGGWGSWGSVYNKSTILVGSGQAFTTIKSALEYANSIGNLKIKVLAGEYDIIDEYGGQSALETAVAGGDYGLTLGFGNTIEFSPRAVVKCLYNGSNNLVMERFSPFNASTTENVTKQGFTLIGLNIVCKNVRYCVHDECAGTSQYRHHKYINCTMYIDNRESPYVDSYKQCIGGGLGKEVRIDVIGGYYKSETANQSGGCISYHNAAGTGATANSKSEINIDGVYFDGGGSASFGYYGISTEITKCYVRNCSMTIAPNVHAETSDSTTVNMQLFVWNNEIR